MQQQESSSAAPGGARPSERPKAGSADGAPGRDTRLLLALWVIPFAVLLTLLVAHRYRSVVFQAELQPVIRTVWGDPIPAFLLETVTGAVSNEDLAGQWTYFLFVEPGCAACEADLAAVDRVAERLQGAARSPARLFAVVVGEPERGAPAQVAARYAAGIAPHLEAAADPDSGFFRMLADPNPFSPETTASPPLHILADPEGRIVLTWHGQLTFAERSLIGEFLLFALLDGSPPIDISIQEDAAADIVDGFLRQTNGEAARLSDLIPEDSMSLITFADTGRRYHPIYGQSRVAQLTRYATCPACPSLVFVWIGGRPPRGLDELESSTEAAGLVIHTWDPDEDLITFFAPEAAYGPSSGFITQSFLVAGTKGLLREEAIAAFDSPFFPLLLAQQCLSLAKQEHRGEGGANTSPRALQKGD